MSKVVVAATQMRCDWNIAGNLDRAERLLRQAAADGAQVVLLQELFETPYFCIEHDPQHLELARTREASETIGRFAKLAAELGIVLPLSWFERAGATQFNSVAVIDADGSVLGTYRKTHIPESVGYHEKFYFSPGDTGFRVWDTRYARLGLGICWDQWFPEAARCMALAGADILMYPTAIGSEPDDETLDSMRHWQNVMCGHAAANMVGVVASNRIGTERARSIDRQMSFYGSSFIADHQGEIVCAAGRDEERILLHEFDIEEMQAYRRGWGTFRDRRPSCYAALQTLDGDSRPPE